MLRYTPHIILLFTLLACTACEDLISPKEDELPPITTEGKNTFGCLVNGEVWLPKGGVNIQSLSFDISNNGDFNLIVNKVKSGTNDNFNFYIPECCDDIIELKSFPDPTVNVRYNDCFYDPSLIDSPNFSIGEVKIIRFDTQEFILSGTFEFRISNDDCDALHVTEGRFDIKYR